MLSVKNCKKHLFYVFFMFFMFYVGLLIVQLCFMSDIVLYISWLYCIVLIKASVL